MRSRRGELRFAPGGELERPARRALERRRATWRCCGAEFRTAASSAPSIRTRWPGSWSALRCATAGDVLLSAAPGYEFVDWGGADHVGGGSHGSLHRSDSLGALLWCGPGRTRAAPAISGRCGTSRRWSANTSDSWAS